MQLHIRRCRGFIHLNNFEKILKNIKYILRYISFKRGNSWVTSDQWMSKSIKELSFRWSPQNFQAHF